jgi:hypothetical protein
LEVAMPSITYAITSEAALIAATGSIDLGGTASAPGTAYTFILTSDLTLSGSLPTIDLAAASSLSVIGDNTGNNNNTALIDGDSVARAFDVAAGSVTLDNLLIQGNVASGGTLTAGGGGALLVAAGATVTAVGASFSGNTVQGGTAAGGDVFVQQGGGFTADGGLFAGGGGGGIAGDAIYIQGNNTISLIGGADITGTIADAAGSGLGAGAGAVAVTAATLAADSTYTGGTQLSGVLTIEAPGALGSGALSFVGTGDTLVIGTGDAPGNTLLGFAYGDAIDLQGIGSATSAQLLAGNTLMVAGGTAASVTLHLDPAQNFGTLGFVLAADAAGGTQLSVVQDRFTVASEADLNTVLAEIDLGGAYAAPGQTYDIAFVNSFTLSSDLYALNLVAGDALTIEGAGNTLDGGGAHRGFFVFAGDVAIADLTIANAVAAGGAGGAGSVPGGGGSGLGGALFVAGLNMAGTSTISTGATVSLADVTFVNDGVVGGNAGAVATGAGGGGGGLGGDGGAGSTHAGGGGGIGLGATGGSGTLAGGGAGIVLGAAGGKAGTGTFSGGSSVPGGGGGSGGGGGEAGTFSGGGGRGGGRSSPGAAGSGGIAGVFGGGGGNGTGVVNSTIDPAGFGGGGASGAGGFGGGGSGGFAGGFGGGGGGSAGGGLGAGADVFVQQGGVLLVSSASLGAGSVAGGNGAGGGSAGLGLGSGLFLQGDAVATIEPGAGQTVSLGGGIADQAGTGGAAALLLAGPGTLLLGAADTLTAGITVDSGTLVLAGAGAAGSGTLDFAYGATAEVAVAPGAVPSGIVAGFLPGVTFDLQGIGTAMQATLQGGDTLAVTGGTAPVLLTLDPGQVFTGETFTVTADGAGGTYLSAIDTAGDHPPHIAGTGTVAADDHTAFAPFAAVTVSDLDIGQTEQATITLSSLADGTLSNVGIGTYDAVHGIWTASGSAASVSAAIEALVFTPTAHQVAPGATVTAGFSLSVTDGIMTAQASQTAVVAALNDPPVITAPGPNGASITHYISLLYGTPAAPFAGYSVIDPDVGASETLTFTVETNLFGATDANGTLSGGGITKTGTGTYTLVGTPAAVSTALGTITFTPVAPTTQAPTFNYVNLSVSDGIVTTPATTLLSISSGLPIFSGTVGGQNLAPGGTIVPFAGVTVADSYTLQSFAITVLDASSLPTDAAGTLSGPGLSQSGTGTYTLTAGSPGAVTTALEALRFTGSASGGNVTLELSAFDGTATVNNYDTTLSVACFAAGTRLAGRFGTVPVEALRAGDALCTVRGVETVRWIGHRTLDCARHPRPWDVLPVRVAKGAFAPGVPSRAVLLSPDHAVFTCGVLIPVRYLVNGTTIRREHRSRVTYFHVELARHGIVFAEGLPCESYLDTGNRAAFANGGTVVAAHPDYARAVWREGGCAPLVVAGATLRAARGRLLARAEVLGFATTPDAGLVLLANGRPVAGEPDGDWTRFTVGNAARLLLFSRAAVPAELLAEAGDERRLGVGVRALVLDGVSVALDDDRLGEGWHKPEEGWRWTDGGAVLPPAREVAVRWFGLPRYVRDEPATRALGRLA